MAQIAIKARKGVHPEGFTSAADATNMGTDTVWLLVAAGTTRDEVLRLLDDLKLRVLDARTTALFPT